jgi:hypothetical protein
MMPFQGVARMLSIAKVAVVLQPNVLVGNVHGVLFQAAVSPQLNVPLKILVLQRRAQRVSASCHLRLGAV